MNVAVKYVGSKPVKRDLDYGTGLTWAPGESHVLPGNVAEFFRRHAEFVLTPSRAKPVVEDAAPRPVHLPPVLDLPDLPRMQPDALVAYAQRAFGARLDARTPVETLRSQVLMMRRAADTDAMLEDA